VSSILKALKKLESRPGAAPLEVARDILAAPEAAAPPRRRLPVLLLAGVAAGMLLYWGLHLEGAPQRPLPARQTAPPAAPSTPDAPAAPPLAPPEILVRNKTLPAEPDRPGASGASAASGKQKKTARLNLVLSDILYRPEPSERMAIVNDLPVMEGMEMEGALIREIAPDRVLLQYDGKSLELRPAQSP